MSKITTELLDQMGLEKHVHDTYVLEVGEDCALTIWPTETGWNYWSSNGSDCQGSCESMGQLLQVLFAWGVLEGKKPYQEQLRDLFGAM